MTDLPAVEAEEAAAPGSRLTLWQGMLAAAIGSAVLSFILTQLLIWAYTEGQLAVAVVGALVYALGLLVWTGLWRTPLQVAGIVAASLAGFVAGYVLAILVANLVSTRPDI